MTKNYLDRQREVLRELSQSADYQRGCEVARQDFAYISLCLDPKTPPHKIFFSRLGNSIGYLCLDFEKALNIETEITDMLSERGAINTALLETPQEHGLGGTPPHNLDPYIPIGVQSSIISLEEAARGRRIMVRTTANDRYFKNPPANCFAEWVPGIVFVTLEHLDDRGRTIMDPRLIDSNLTTLETEYSADFPFRRV